ncbi:ribonuclease HII [Propionispira raffinosivorans]|uniref:ribonuclease HII n=1 Tax=Propionispira raffinosivorans TaxID=86959 RepID=UPI00035CB24C|nr:ribonuclease HII [Propionispira raffinosivorans]
MDIQKMTIKEIEILVKQKDLMAETITALTNDTRSAVQRLFRKWEREQNEIQRVDALYKYEYQFQKQGIEYIAGVDEAGRGPLAGPVFVASVILPIGLYIPKINDSKKISAKVRESIYELLLKEAIAIERSIVDEKTIDRINIYQATINGMYNAILSLKPKPQQVLIDAVPLEQLEIPSLSLIKGDAISASIAAASIVAKVERDHMMDEYDKMYPEYGFAQHKGYGTAQHVAALKKYGPCPIHRRSFEPVKSLVKC